ncbi:MAG: hypothetical protein HKO79_01050 [Desulfobacterales bacterium]|nr:hypothetical protein [Desulfobacterales bacterium]
MASHITAIPVFQAEAIAQNESSEYVVDLSRYDCEGFFSLQLGLSGAGQVDVTWSVSANNVDFITPADTDPIFDDFTVASGPGSDGKDIASFDTPLARWLKITVTEANVGAVVAGAWLTIQ